MRLKALIGILALIAVLGNGIVLAAPAGQGRMLHYGTTVEGHIDDSGYADAWFFYGMAGDTITILMEATSGDLDCYLVLADEGGREITRDDDSGSGYNARIETTLPAAGFYTIVATRYGWESGPTSGDYRLSLGLTIGGAWTAPVTRQLYISLSWESFADLDLAVVEPGGNTISWTEPLSPSGGALDSLNGNDFCRDLIQWPVETIYWPGGNAPTGTYTILVTYALNCGNPPGPVTFELAIWDEERMLESLYGSVDENGSYSFSFVYQPTAVVIQATPTATTPPVVPTQAYPTHVPVNECPGAPPSRVRVGDHARVTYTDGRPLRIRDAPGGAYITQIPEGAEFDIVGGPRCNAGYTWWQIRTVTGTIGWVAEGEFGNYYIEPWGIASWVPTPAATTPTAITECPGAPPIRMHVGDHGRVTYSDGRPLRVRDSAGGRIITRIPEGTRFDVIGGPQCQAGFTWWQIRTTSGVVGWVAEGEFGNYYIEPL